MRIVIITLFPEMLNGFFVHSILKRAQDKNLVEIELVDLRSFALDRRGTVDDKPYGGGKGMVLMAPPVVMAIQATRKRIENSRTILTSVRGDVLNQYKVHNLTKFNELIIVCGHYEGFDERISNYVDEEISLGDFILTGGEIAAVALVDAVVRLVPGVLSSGATTNESFMVVKINDLISAVGSDAKLIKLQEAGVKEVKLLEYPQYTRPKVFAGRSVPDVLCSGDHARIKKWQLQEAYRITCERRSDLLGLE